MTADTVLMVTASYDIGPEYVGRALSSRGVPIFRLDTDKFPSEVLASFSPPHDVFLSNGPSAVLGSQIKSVWYRRHVSPDLPDDIDSGVRDFCKRETKAFLDGLLAVLPTDRWLSSPQAIARAERKPYQLAVAAQLGFVVPETLVTNDKARVHELAERRRLIAKAVSSGYVASPVGNKAIFTSALASDDLRDLSGLSLAPVTFQELVDKVSDIRVTVVADEVFAAEILSQDRKSSQIDWRATDDPDLVHRKHDLSTDVARLCRQLVARLGLVFGAIDLALTQDGTYVFFEINPNGEWLWLEDRLGFPISERLAQWLDSECS